MGSITPAMKHFLSAEKFAVIGRVLTDPSRWDNKVLRWYKDRSLPVVPVRPGKEGGKAEGLDILTDPTAIPDLSHTSISIIIHPSISLSILKQLFPIPLNGNEPWSVWFQPGADDEHVRAYVKERGLEERVVLGGRCVLVDGDRGLKAVKEAGKL